ncbi:MAG: hypothetical protein JW720_11730 [Sedimentisphaerales bacterium]|nr:hypothetical protein [Sedimentisphaerales bacterium]
MKQGLLYRILLIGVFFLPLFAGCNAPKSNLKKFDGYFTSGNYDQSIAFAESKLGKGNKTKREDLLWTLQLGSLERLRRNHETSGNYFDRSEELLNKYDTHNKAADTVGSVVVNENIVPYLGEEYDGVMVNTYKALNFMALKKDDLARVEFNRALDRQRRAKEKFAKEIVKLQQEIDAEQAKPNSQARNNVENPQVDAIVNEKYPNLNAFEAYPDFVNPFTTYLAGVYFNLVGDHTKAVDLLKESYGMVQDNRYLAEDLAVTEKLLDSQGKLENTVWVVFENGLGPYKKEIRLDLPLFLVTREVKYVGIALPKLVFRDQAFDCLWIKAGEANYQTLQLASMDRVIQTEFKKDFKGILTRAIISATAKAAAQYAMQNQNNSAGSFASILMAAYSFATTAADVRIWTTLPKDFQVARFAIPEDRSLRIHPSGGAPFDVKIPNCNNAVVYVKIPLAGSVPAYDVITY